MTTIAIKPRRAPATNRQNLGEAFATVIKHVAKPTTRARLPVAKAQAQISRVAAKGQQIHAIVEKGRPAFGHALYAHTHAALSVLGLFEKGRHSVAEGTLVSFIGQRAVNYHIEKGNMEKDGTSVRLTPEGRDRFQERYGDGKIDREQVDQYISLFLDGDVGQTGVLRSQIVTLQR